MKTIYRSLNTWKTRTNSFSEEKNLTSKVGWKNVRPCNQKGSNYKSHENEKLSKSITKELCSPVSGNLIQTLYIGFIFGLVAYGTYNLTNMAVLKGWSPTVTFVDMFWGGSLTAVSATSGLYLAKKIVHI